MSDSFLMHSPRVGIYEPSQRSRAVVLDPNNQYYDVGFRINNSKDVAAMEGFDVARKAVIAAQEARRRFPEAYPTAASIMVHPAVLARKHNVSVIDNNTSSSNHYYYPAPKPFTPPSFHRSVPASSSDVTIRVSRSPSPSRRRPSPEIENAIRVLRDEVYREVDRQNEDVIIVMKGDRGDDGRSRRAMVTGRNDYDRRPAYPYSHQPSATSSYSYQPSPSDSYQSAPSSAPWSSPIAPFTVSPSSTAAAIARAKHAAASVVTNENLNNIGHASSFDRLYTPISRDLSPDRVKKVPPSSNVMVSPFPRYYDDSVLTVRAPNTSSASLAARRSQSVPKSKSVKFLGEDPDSDVLILQGDRNSANKQVFVGGVKYVPETKYASSNSYYFPTVLAPATTTEEDQRWWQQYNSNDNTRYANQDNRLYSTIVPTKVALPDPDQLLAARNRSFQSPPTYVQVPPDRRTRERNFGFLRSTSPPYRVVEYQDTPTKRLPITYQYPPASPRSSPRSILVSNSNSYGTSSSPRRVRWSNAPISQQ